MNDRWERRLQEARDRHRQEVEKRAAEPEAQFEALRQEMGKQAALSAASSGFVFFSHDTKVWMVGRLSTSECPVWCAERKVWSMRMRLKKCPLRPRRRAS